jgi:hypothetical protein
MDSILCTQTQLGLCYELHTYHTGKYISNFITSYALNHLFGALIHHITGLLSFRIFYFIPHWTTNENICHFLVSLCLIGFCFHLLSCNCKCKSDGNVGENVIQIYRWIELTIVIRYISWCLTYIAFSSMISSESWKHPSQTESLQISDIYKWCIWKNVLSATFMSQRIHTSMHLASH